MFFSELQMIDARIDNMTRSPRRRAIIPIREWSYLHGYDSEADDTEREADRWSPEVAFKVRNAR